jgi:pilus assembly protein CpaB
VTVKVDENTSGGGLIRPGDRVDLVLFLRRSADVPETTTRTILWDVNVFAVGGKVQRDDDKQGSSREVRSVSLLVTPKQAESVMLAKELGVLSLSLRRPGDTVSELASGETIKTLLGSDGENANEKKKKEKEKPVEIVVPTPPPLVEPQVVVEPPPQPPAFTMTIRTNNGDHTFVFSKLYGPPSDEAGSPVPTASPSNSAPQANGASSPPAPSDEAAEPVRSNANPPSDNEERPAGISWGPGQYEPYPPEKSKEEPPVVPGLDQGT